MSLADQNAIVAVLRRDRALSAADWTVAALAPAAGLKKQACRDAIEALRYQGKMEWTAIALSPSMLAADDGDGEPVPASPPEASPTPTPTPTRGWIDNDDADRLREEVRAYLQRTGMALNTFSNRATNSDQIASFTRGTGRVGINAAQKAREFMAQYPNGVTTRKGVSHQQGFAVDEAQAAVAVSARAAVDDQAADITQRADAVVRSREIARQAALEAESRGTNRREAQKLSGTLTAAAAFVPTPVEMIQTALAETPADAMRALQRRWPDLWQQLLIAARASGITPARMMIEAIETGLAAIEPVTGDELQERVA